MTDVYVGMCRDDREQRLSLYPYLIHAPLTVSMVSKLSVQRGIMTAACVLVKLQKYKGMCCCDVSVGLMWQS